MTSPTPGSLGFIGLGAMGWGMATNLLKAGYKVRGFDVWGPTMTRFQEAGGAVAESAAEAVAGMDVIVCMVATAQQADSVLVNGPSSAIQTAPKDATILLCSTVPCAYVQSLEKDLSSKGRADIHLVDCPVSGGAIRAADGTLSIMAAGSAEAIEKARPLLLEMSDPAKLYIVEGGIGQGSNMKMVHQVLAANHILCSSEAMGFADHLGLDLKEAAGLILKSKGWCWMLENRLPRILAPDHKPIASAVTIILKDTSIITSEAMRLNFPTPMTSIAEQFYFTAVGRGYGPDDDGGLIRMYTEGKGKVGPVHGTASTTEEKVTLVVNLLKGIYLCAAAEALSMAKHVGLDLDQVLDLCINAAGGSHVLTGNGPRIIEHLRQDGRPAVYELEDLTEELSAAVQEAQRLKAPVFLGSAALNLMKVSLDRSREVGA